MILPIVSYGSSVLRKVGKNIDFSYPELEKLIVDMKETMKAAKGVGLAAPQIGISIRLFLIDASPFADYENIKPEEVSFLEKFKRVFINAKILKEEGDEWAFNEGCLSIPDVREDVLRKEKITVEFQDEKFEKQILVLNGLASRIFQHEYDHIEGVLFIDRLSPLKKRLLKKKLANISKGEVKVDYKMRFPNSKIT